MGVLAVAILALAVMAATASAAKHPFLETFGSGGQPAFGAAKGLAVDQSTGDVLVIDSSAAAISRYNPDGTPANFSALGSNVIDGQGAGDGTPQGGLSFGLASEVQVAVDNSGGPADGDIYVTQSGQHLIDIFAADGSYLGQLTAAGANDFGEACGVAVDEDGAVYVGDFSNVVHKFAPTANPPVNGDNTANFTSVLRPCSVAAGSGLSAGSLFVAAYGGAVSKIDSATGELDYVLSEGSNTTVAVEPTTGYAYVAKGNTVNEFDASTPSAATPVSSISLASAAEGVAISGTSGNVYLSRSGSPDLDVFGPTGLPVPEIGVERVASESFGSVTVQANINPEGSATTYHIEYGIDTSYGLSTEESAVGSDKVNHTVSTTLSELSPNTAYHWRVVATNAAGVTVGTDHTFHTFAAPAGSSDCPNGPFRTGASAGLPDCRAYEMVTPIDKNNTDIVALFGFNGIPAALNQSAQDGQRLTYTTSQGFGDAPGVPYVSQYLASRGPEGWSNHSITPPQGRSKVGVGRRLDMEYRAFSADLCSGALVHSTDLQLAPDAAESAQNLYRRQICGEEGYEALTTTALPSSSEPEIKGISPDGTCVVFETEILQSGEGSIYESCDGEVRPISISPSGDDTIGSVGTQVTSLGGIPPRSGVVAGAMSDDGSRVYWSRSGSLFLRINARQPQSAISGGECTETEKACTVEVSAALPGKAQYWSASSDGSRVLFNVGQSLYEFNLAERTSIQVVPTIQGMLGASEDASRFFFTSGEVLTGANVEGNEPTAGLANLYLFDSSKSGADRFRFVATLSADDTKAVAAFSPVSLESYLKISRVSPDGGLVAFNSVAALTGYDNSDVDTGQKDSEIFVYAPDDRGGEGGLHCISCNPSGQRPAGRNILREGFPSDTRAAALLPPYETELYGPHVISDDGSRVFFNSYDALVPRDTNGKGDVYEWETPGAGQCNEESPEYSSSNGGCLYLISSGESPSDSSFVDASPDGRDAFFTTASSLLPQDPGLIDIYDARSGGGFPPPPSFSAPCEGEACQGPPAPPNDPTPASAVFNGAGNLRDPSGARCGGRQGKQHCAKKKKHAKKRHRAHKQMGRAANNNRRNAR